jgi:hypothetical protein
MKGLGYFLVGLFKRSSVPKGALVVFGLDGKTRQTVAGLDRPNNCRQRRFTIPALRHHQPHHQR